VRRIGCRRRMPSQSILLVAWQDVKLACILFHVSYKATSELTKH
jgi:hypothetical protein